MYPPGFTVWSTAAANFVPSLEEVIARQYLAPAPVRAVQVAPLLVEV